MKKRLVALALLLCMVPVSVSAAGNVDVSGYSITDAAVSAVQFVDVTAPFSGTLNTFDLEAGDVVEMGDGLFSMLTTDIYAPEDGTVTGLFVAQGDDATAAMNIYGSVGAMDADRNQRISCTTAGAFDDEENRQLHVGETLYFKSSRSGEEEGQGRVISVTGNAYVVEILSGDFDIGEYLTMYRSSSRTAKTNVGRGTVIRRDPVMLSGGGIVSDVYVTEGQQVKQGDKLMSFISDDADRNASPEITAQHKGVVAKVAVSTGQQVWKGQLLCRIYLMDELEIVADVDEIDLGTLDAGSSVYVALDTDKDNMIPAKITEISELGVIKQNAAYYTVHVKLNDSDNIRIGQSASLYLPKN